MLEKQLWSLEKWLGATALALTFQLEFWNPSVVFEGSKLLVFGGGDTGSKYMQRSNKWTYTFMSRCRYVHVTASKSCT